MAYGDIKRLTAQGAQLASTTTTVYTSPAGTKAEIATILLHNTTNAAKDVELYVYGTTAASRILNITLAANETYEFSPKLPLVLNGGDTVAAKANAASEINVRLLGREETGVSSLWTPAAITTALWLDASDSDTITLSTGVSEWRDKSGNNHHLSQANSGNQPSYSNNTISFTSTTVLAISNIQIFSGATQGSVFYVGSQPSGSFGAWGRFGGTGGGNLHTPFSDGNIYESFLSANRVAIGSVPYLLPVSVMNYNNNGTALEIRRNATVVGSGAITFAVPTTANQFLGGMAGPFAHSEVVFFTSVLTQTNREKMEGYLAHKWNLTSALPSNHPYKSTAPTL